MLTINQIQFIIVLSDEASKSEIQKARQRMLDMAISEKELKLLMNFIKDDLTEAKESEETEKKNKKIDRVLEHIQQYLEDQSESRAGLPPLFPFENLP